MKSSFSIMCRVILLLLPLISAAYSPSSSVRSDNNRIREYHHHHHMKKPTFWPVKEIRCEVTQESPLSKDVTLASERLMKYGKDELVNPTESGCTTLVTVGSARIVTCGEIPTKRMDCKKIANFIWRLNYKCQTLFDGEEEPRVGGKIVFDWGSIIAF